MRRNSPEQTAAYSLIEGEAAVYVRPEPEPEGARVWFFTRLGGISEQPFDSLNVSKKVGDEGRLVEENLRRIRETMGNRASAWVKQVAGDEVLRVSEAGFAGEGDALATGEDDLCLTVAVADCVPVVLAGDERVALVHSGWRGTLSGISGKAVHEMGAGARAYIGPCIRGCCYEVSEELAAEFAEKFGTEVVSGRMLSLPAVIRRDLESVGAEVHDLGLCTGCRPDLFFSHRKQKPRTGRNLAAVAKTPPVKTSR